eukprot:702517_1
MATNSHSTSTTGSLNCSKLQRTEKRRVRAITRIRPFFATDQSTHQTELESCVVPLPPNKIAFRQQKYNEIIQQTFKFDAVYHVDITQQNIFTHEVEPLIGHALNGKKCTVFCYGPTGSGKTFTAFGGNDNPGIMARTMTQLLSIKTDTIRIHLSCLEIYNERVYDLLSSSKSIHQQTLSIRQNGSNIVVQGLIKRELMSMEQFYDIYEYAMKRRKTAFTALNAHSSRSHAIFTVYIEQKVLNKRICGKISIADLAGSENNKRTLNRGERLKESANINKSLLALGAVIDALNKGTRAPYRDSILTRLLSDCLGGDSISTMVCCVSGLLQESSMTRRCLEFGSQTRKIENKVIAHIVSDSDRDAAKIPRKRRRIEIASGEKENNNSHNLPKRKKIKYNHNTNNSNNSNNSSHAHTKKIKYAIKPTPSKFLPKNVEELQVHEQQARNKLIHKIDELTEIGRSNARQIEQLMEIGACKEKTESKEEEREVSVYRNDEFGLPPTMTPHVANPALAIDFIKEGRRIEKNGQIDEALALYKRAKKLLPNHKGLSKKIEKLRLKKMNEKEKVIKVLSFDDDDDDDDDKQKVQAKKRSRRRTLKNKKSMEIMSSGPDNDHSDGDDMLVPSPPNATTVEYSFSIDVQRVLDTMNKSNLDQLKTLHTVGPKKANAIISKRPFNKINDLRKVRGLHTQKTWKSFIESNRLMFEQFA